ncbi:hypothetical protein LINGRAHAP2_LOCUS5581 [Linum grandiflorum]
MCTERQIMLLIFWPITATLWA